MDEETVRKEFIDFYKNKGHKFLKPSKIFIDDPTLFFVNAGMNQLKEKFLTLDPIEGVNRLVNYQHCVRAGGKHNDLEDVGGDSYHLTSFEMLGNWSLCDYWKEEAISWAFDFLIDVCHLNPEQLYVTYYEGNDDVEMDHESRDIWNKYLPIERIVPGNFNDNFWMMDNEGPCGRSTEIHYDLIGNRLATDKVNKNDPFVIEIWNIVFIEFEKKKDKFYKLVNRFVDAGLGFERLNMILQGKFTIYSTSIFRKLTGYCQALTGAEIYTDSYDVSNKIDYSYRIFADHMKTTILCLCQGVKFDSNKRGYILRKIFRRCLTHMYIYLCNKKVSPLMIHPLIQSLVFDICNYHSQKQFDLSYISKCLIDEEKLYLNTIKSAKNNYLKLLRKNNDIDQINYKLKDTFGVYDLIVNNIDSLVF